MCAYIVSKGVSTPPPPFSKFPPPKKKIGFPNFLKSPSPPPSPPPYQQISLSKFSLLTEMQL